MMQAITQTYEYPVVFSNRKAAIRYFNSGRMIEICFNIIEVLGDSLIGAFLGAMIGWCSGLCIASVYKNVCEPTHLASFDLVNKWYYLSCEYAGEGIVIGAAGGVLFVFVMTLVKMAKNSEQESNQKTVEIKTVS